MSVKDPSWLADHLRRKKRVLIMAGALCDQIELEGKSLLDYAAEISKKMKAPIAATGNTVNGLRQRGIDTSKAWAIEMVNFTHYEWQHPIIDGKPDAMVFIGYSPTLASNLASAVKDVETVVLGNTYVDEATYSLPGTTSYKDWQKELSDFVQALEN
jgi:CO dehydrogenase/acetyl-CoA synthase epsilon subunit